MEKKKPCTSFCTLVVNFYHFVWGNIKTSKGYMG